MDTTNHMAALSRDGYILARGPELDGISDTALTEALRLRLARKTRSHWPATPETVRQPGLTPQARRVVHHLRTAGKPVSRSQIRSDVFSRNCPRGMLDHIRAELLATGELQITKVHSGGRPTELWSLLPDDPWATQPPVTSWTPVTKPQIP